MPAAITSWRESGSDAARRALGRRLLAWYDGNRRDLPWRAAPGGRPDPYRVWLSEIMLQQTTVATVKPYFHRFVARWPGVADLAAASLDEVLVAWQGLGYYARARNLHACARTVAGDGGFPDTEEGLRALPGVGAYTAAAIAAIAFGRPAVPVDGNVVRVISRVAALDAVMPAARPLVERLARTLLPDRRPGDFAQALMDLGATVCTPRSPRCDACPWAADCMALAAGRPEAFPVKAARRDRPVRHGVAFWVTGPGETVLLRRRPPDGLLGGMMEIPSTPWRDEPWSQREALRFAPLTAAWQPLPNAVMHVFTHFRLEMAVVTGRLAATAPVPGGRWVALDGLDGEPLPTLMRKIAAAALSRAASRSAPGWPGYAS
ncbi:MAG: A/G-specific adenine glycosylase [Rhodospirillales bacterium]|nr:MAG: A/G-specific adenine glycosylase [Rhodospirillales bacterium]